VLKKMRGRAKQVFTVMIISMWAVSFLVDIANPKYEPPDYVNPLIMLVAGYMFATNVKHSDKTKHQEEDEDEDGE
jgi:hypothetical protein